MISRRAFIGAIAAASVGAVMPPACRPTYHWTAVGVDVGRESSSTWLVVWDEGKVRAITELLGKTNEVFEDMAWIEGRRHLGT